MTCCNANKVTLEEIEGLISTREFFTLGKKTTVCLLTLNNGFEVIGTAACVKAEDYNQEIGAKFAYQRAVDKIWEVEGYYRQKLSSCCAESEAAAPKAEMTLNTTDPT
jgi:hypothetical protein